MNKKRRKSKKTYYSDNKYKRIRKCPCGKRLGPTQRTYCSKACRMNPFYGVPQNRPKYIEYTFSGCGHTRLVHKRYLLNEIYGKYCSIECYPRGNFDNNPTYKHYKIYSGKCKRINILDGIASDIETRELVRYKLTKDGKYEKCEKVETR